MQLQYAGQEVLICTYGGKYRICLSHIAPWRHSYQNCIRKLIVSYSDTFKRLIKVHRFASSNLAFAMNTTDIIKVVFCKSAYSIFVTHAPVSMPIVGEIKLND